MFCTQIYFSQVPTDQLGIQIVHFNVYLYFWEMGSFELKENGNKNIFYLI
jgi:hypothetical protein